MSPLERLDRAIDHFEAAADGEDPGRLGLAFAEVVLARNELRAESAPPESLKEARIGDAERHDLERIVREAVERTRARLEAR